MLRKFLKNRDGNFAVTLALCLVPVMLGAGAALDYAGASKDRTRLQNALDAGILAVGIDFPSMSNLQVQTKIKDYLKSNLPPEEYDQIKNIIVTPDVQGRYLTARAVGEADTSLMMLAGMRTLRYEAEAQIKAASGGAEIAFVLDNTGSMSVDGKMVALKNAATNFTNAIMRKATGGDVKIGIVPFSNHVNVGMANRNATWITVPADSTTTEDNYCYMTSDVIPGTCTTQSGTNSEGQTYSYQQCQYGAAYEVCGPRTITNAWYGCVGSQASPYNLEDRNYGSNPVPGVMNVTCGSEITPLTNVKSTVLDNIDAMVASGDTYIPAGLVWGLRLLSDKAPYTQAVSKTAAASGDIKKYLVLMTDGDNTRSAQLPDEPTHWGGDTTQANTWTTTACDNIKAEGIRLFTITFGTLLPDTKTLIEGCATSSAQYFHAATGDELNGIFEEIRAQISALHLSM